jgi:hypothetical protein
MGQFNLFSTKIKNLNNITVYNSSLLQQFIHLITGKFFIKTTAKKNKQTKYKIMEIV